ncbi:hypothetical protein K8O92_33240 (plasmid) [Nocardia asteroides]|nr:hypothetical protein K8O92_33240 [Nocardia asteroides]
MGFPISIPAPTTILTRKAPIEELASYDKRDETLIIEIDVIDRAGASCVRSALVKTITSKFDRAANPQRTIEVVFAHPGLAPRTYPLGEQVTVHYLTYEHLEQL